ncbi:MAG: formylglycine-generating enzyme family protein [Planctomycetaceae bacterium]|nr:formylglycine-generating enzyme family protein [Planctomycetaceae bacterium]
MLFSRFFLLASVGFFTLLIIQQADASVMVTVGNINNEDDDTGYGAVDYEYRISATEVTNSEYATFLNAVAATDTYSLYNSFMSGTYGGISQNGSSGNFSYSVNSDRGENPVAYVTFYDALRYTNWLHNGQGTGNTETGAYTITDEGITNNSITRNTGATWFLPNEDEWYKAAYYDPTLNSNTGGYFDYATRSDVAPTAELPAGGINSANYHMVFGNTTAVGAYTSALSPYGTYDQSGNLWEWNETIIDSSNRGLRGGDWSDTSNYLSSSVRLGYISPAIEDNSSGFRVASLSSPASVPEPGSLAVWAVLGGIGLCWRRRRARAKCASNAS